MTTPGTVLVSRFPDMTQRRVAFQMSRKLKLDTMLASFLKSCHILVRFYPFRCWSLSLSNETMSVTQEVWSKHSLVNMIFFSVSSGFSISNHCSSRRNGREKSRDGQTAAGT